ncbi:MAG: AMIN domain-containing protein, partial [Magnetococcales bacterium]|nr:AMIN domain-containing protein [Magnetococcales bacterium]
MKRSKTVAKGMIRNALILGIAILAGCMATTNRSGDKAVPEEVAQPTVMIQRIDVSDAGSNTLIRILANGPLTHDLVQLDQPERLLFTFEEAGLNPAIQPRIVNTLHATGLFPRETGKKRSQLEVTLRGKRPYEVTERMDGLDLTLRPAVAEVKKSGVPYLRDVQVAPADGGTILRLIGSDVLPTPRSFRLTKPPRLVLDIQGVTSRVETARLTPNTQEVLNIQTGSSKDRVRVVVDLASSEITHRIEANNGHPIIHFGHGRINVPGAAPVQAQPGEQASMKQAVPLDGGAHHRVVPDPMVEDIRFRRDEVVSEVRISLNRTDAVLSSRQDDNTVVVTLTGVAIPDALVRRMDVSAFGGTVSAVDAYAKGGDTMLLVRMSDPTALFEVLQKERDILVRVQPRASINNEGLNADQNRFTGQRITMDFKDIDVQNALKLIAEISNRNIITSDSVKGTLTMRLVDVPVDQALDLILEAKG